MPEATEAHTSPCRALAVIEHEMPLYVSAIRTDMANNDRLYMQLFKASDDRVAVAMTAAEKAMQTALTVVHETSLRTEAAAEKRFGEMGDRLTLVGDSLSKQIAIATAAQEGTKGRALGVNASWGYLLGAILIASFIVNLIVLLTNR